jgi:hypothetical protein
MSIELHSLLKPARKQRRMTKSGVLIAVSVAAVIATVVAFSQETSPLMRWVHERDRIRERDGIASVMVPLANAGKPDAVIWYAKNYADAPLAPILKLADAGNAQAMWLLADRTFNTDRAGALHLVHAAALEGYPDAVAFERLDADKRLLAAADAF